MHTSSRVGPCLLFVLFCADSASSCSTIGNLHEALLPQLPQSQALPARSSRSPCNYMERDLLGEIRDTRKHRTHSFTFDVIATALQVVGVVVVVHSRLVLFIAKLSLFLGCPWRQRALLIRTDEPQPVQVAQVAEISCQMSPLATATTKEFTHGARMWQLQQSALENGDFFFSARVQFACVCHAICLCPHLGCSSCSSSVVVWALTNAAHSINAIALQQQAQQLRKQRQQQ